MIIRGMKWFAVFSFVVIFCCAFTLVDGVVNQYEVDYGFVCVEYPSFLVCANTAVGYQSDVVVASFFCQDSSMNLSFPEVPDFENLIVVGRLFFAF